MDAKYKGHTSLFENNQREDRFQLLAYMHIFKAPIGALIVPIPIVESGDITGGGKMQLIGMSVKHNCSSYFDYNIQMNQSETALKTTIGNLISNNN